jgi:uncharacterized protein (TIGR03382 family)
VLKTGDTVFIRSGTYNEKVDFWHVKAGTGGRTTIRAAAGHKPVIDGTGLSGFVFQAGETHKMTFRELTVKNASGSAFHFYKADHGEVIDCTTDKVGAGVSFYYASFGLVENSDIYGGINGKGSDGTVLKGNKIHHNDAEGITLHADSKNCKYLNNIVYDNYSVNIYIDSASNMVVDGNLVYMTFTPTKKEMIGIMLADESYPNVTAPVLKNITITNNILINNDWGFAFWQGHFPGKSGMKDVTFANNTVINNRKGAITWDPGAHQNAVMRNNILGGGTAKLQIYGESSGGVKLDHNLWHLPGVAKPFNWLGKLYSHAGWVAASGHGAGDVLGDPKLVGAWQLPWTNLKLTAGSPAVDKGLAVAGLTHDFAGKARPAGAAYDIGALEHGSTINTDSGPPPPTDSGPPGDTGAPLKDSSTTGDGPPDGSTAHDGAAVDSPAGDGPAGAPSEDDGCSCALGSDRGGAAAAALLLLASFALLLRRRRDRG